MRALVKSPAKINLALDILSKRDDGYHEVEMIMQAVDLYDDVLINTNNHNDIKLNCKLNTLNSIESNTAYKAAKQFFEFTNIKNPGIDIDIVKRIPEAAGLAGGSADAAGVIVGLNHIFNTKLSKEDLTKIGSKIGADVPFSIIGGTMVASGIGTNLRRINNLVSCYIVLAKPHIFVSTKEAYDKSDNSAFRETFKVEDVEKAIDSSDIKRISATIFNRFESVMELEEVKRIKESMIELGALNACMSGSGPSVFSIFNNEQDAVMCADVLKGQYDDVFLCKPIKSGCEVI